jgi:HAD superfamily hydrolase (TIGR01509 family)
MSIKAILFDHDGTLVNSEYSHFKIWQQVLRGYGVNFSEDLYKADHSGIPTPKNADLFIERFNLSDSCISLIAQKEAATREYLLNNPYPLMPLVIEVIELLASHDLAMAVVTGAAGESARCTLKDYDLEKYFTYVASGDDVINSKPAPDVYLHAVEKLKLKPDQCIALEDTQTGIQAAHDAGIICCAIPNVFSIHHDFTLANYIANDLPDAFNWIESNFLLN